MADPTGPTEEELESNLATQFDKYVDEIKRVLALQFKNVAHVLNSLEINGYSLADLIAIIAGEVKTHEDNRNNPHTETLAQLGGISATAYEQQAGAYFKKDALTISKIPSFIGAISGTTLTVNASSMIYRGRDLVVPRAVLALTGTATLYLKLNVAGAQPGRVVSLTVEADDSETATKFLAGIITVASGVWSVTMIPGVFLGTGRLTSTPRGRGIPMSTGSQAAPGSINTNWIG